MRGDQRRHLTNIAAIPRPHRGESRSRGSAEPAGFRQAADCSRPYGQNFRDALNMPYPAALHWAVEEGLCAPPVADGAPSPPMVGPLPAGSVVLTPPPVLPGEAESPLCC